MKKTILTLALAGILTVGGTVLAFADEATSTAGRRGCADGVTKVQELIDNGVSFEDAKLQMMDEKIAKIDEAVKNGTMTEEKANELKAQLKERTESCTTPGENRNNGEGGMGLGLGKGNGNGKGMGKGNGNGMRLRNGSCQ